MFEHIDILSIGIQLQPYTVTPLGFWVTCGVKMMSSRMVEANSNLKLLPASILDIYTVFEHIDMLSIGI